MHTYVYTYIYIFPFFEAVARQTHGGHLSCARMWKYDGNISLFVERAPRRQRRGATSRGIHFEIRIHGPGSSLNKCRSIYKTGKMRMFLLRFHRRRCSRRRNSIAIARTRMKIRLSDFPRFRYNCFFFFFIFCAFPSQKKKKQKSLLTSRYPNYFDLVSVWIIGNILCLNSKISVGMYQVFHS